MKRVCLFASALASVFLAASTASAEPYPAVLYIPDEEITLNPIGVAPCSGFGSQTHSAFGCVSGIDGPTAKPPFEGDLEALTTGIRDALADFDVHVTHERPPEYLPYFMLMPSTTPNEESTGWTCTSAASNCGARQRNDLAFTNGGTMNCSDPDPLHAALMAFGYLSGLEGVANVNDPMNYPPDYTMPVTGYADECADRVPPLNDMMMETPLQCTNADHTGCTSQQNSVADLLAVYGPRMEDNEPPTFSNIVPEDGAVIQSADGLTMDVDISDSDPIVGVRWTVSSPALEGAVPGGVLSKCTNLVCDSEWASPYFNPTDGDWSFVLTGLPAGEYTITLEAADFHGNVAETVTINVTIEGGSGGDGGVDDTGGDDGSTGDDGDGFTSADGDDGSGGSDSGTTAASEDGDGGCGCTQAPGRGGAALMLLGLVGLGLGRRRR